MSKKAIVMRGLPGAGKSSAVKLFLKQATAEQKTAAVHSTDKLFEKTSGEYVFDAKKLPEYHEQNRQHFKASLINNVNLVICDNTNIEAWQYMPYVELAKNYGYEVEVISIGLFHNSSHIDKYWRRNSHEIDKSVIESMAKKSQGFYHRNEIRK